MSSGPNFEPPEPESDDGSRRIAPDCDAACLFGVCDSERDAHKDVCAGCSACHDALPGRQRSARNADCVQQPGFDGYRWTTAVDTSAPVLLLGETVPPLGASRTPECVPLCSVFIATFAPVPLRVLSWCPTAVRIQPRYGTDCSSCVDHQVH